MKVKNSKKEVKGIKKIDKSFNFNPKKEDINHIKELLSEYDDNNIKNFKKYINDTNFIIDNNKINNKDSNKIINKLKEINEKNNIIKKIKSKMNKLPKNIIDDFNYLNITKMKIKDAIIKYVQKKYNEMSIFSIDIKYILDNKWDVLTDTSVKEEIKILLEKNYKNMKNTKNMKNIKKNIKYNKKLINNKNKINIVDSNENKLNNLLKKNKINDDDEEYITKLFSENKKIMKEYFNKFIKKIYLLKSKKNIIKIDKEICIYDEFLKDKKIKFKLNKGDYEIFVNNYIKNISSMIIIKIKQKFNFKNIKFSKTNKILEIDDSQNIIINEINLELKGKQFFGSYNIFIGKIDKEIKIIVIPLIDFLNYNII